MLYKEGMGVTTGFVAEEASLAEGSGEPYRFPCGEREGAAASTCKKQYLTV
jgi:hypothetical protein